MRFVSEVFYGNEREVLYSTSRKKKKNKLNGGSRSQGKSSISLQKGKNKLPVEAGLLEKGSKQRKSFFNKKKGEKKWRSE